LTLFVETMPLSNYTPLASGYWGTGPWVYRPHDSYSYPWTLVNDSIEDSQRQREITDAYMAQGRSVEDKLEDLFPKVETRVVNGVYNARMHIVSGINPHDLSVSLKNHIMTVEGKRERNCPSGCSRIYQEFSRRFVLPENVEAAEVKTLLTVAGYLEIKAPLKLSEEEKKKQEKSEAMPEAHLADAVETEPIGAPSEGFHIPITISME